MNRSNYRSRLSACNHSFSPETQVLLADGSTKAIKDITVGDSVLATDPMTGVTTASAVTALHINQDDDLADITVRNETTGQTTVIHTTWHHPFWSPDTHAWVDADHLAVGDRLQDLTTGRANVVVVATRTWTGDRQMRDLTIADIHTYYVVAGDTPVLVHNDGGGDLPGREQAQQMVMRMAGIPLDATPIDTLQNASGVQYVYEVDGKYMLVTENTMDSSHPGAPHWEAGEMKPNQQVDNYGRYRVSNDKVKVFFSPGGC